jgi:hypothetical protein
MLHLKLNGMPFLDSESDTDGRTPQRRYAATRGMDHACPGKRRTDQNAQATATYPSRFLVRFSIYRIDYKERSIEDTILASYRVWTYSL